MTKYTIEFTDDEIRELFKLGHDDEDITDEKVEEIAAAIMDLFDSYLFDWINE